MKDKQPTLPNDVAFLSVAFPSNESETYGFGLTKREYFAAIALQGLLANSTGGHNPVGYAVQYADQLIQALNEG